MKKVIAIVFLAMAVLCFFHCQKTIKDGDKAQKQNSEVESMLLKMEREWSDAAISRDGSVLERILSPDFICHHANSQVLNKREEINNLVNNPVTYTDIRLEDMKIHMCGRILAVITGGATWSGQNQDGKEFNAHTRWTNIWLKKEGQWHCIVGHGSLVSGKGIS